MLMLFRYLSGMECFPIQKVPVHWIQFWILQDSGSDLWNDLMILFISCVVPAVWCPAVLCAVSYALCWALCCALCCFGKVLLTLSIQCASDRCIFVPADATNVTFLFTACPPPSTAASLRTQSSVWSNHTRQFWALNPCHKWLKSEKQGELSASPPSVSWSSYSASHFSIAGQLWILTWKPQILRKCFLLASARLARSWSANQIYAMLN